MVDAQAGFDPVIGYAFAKDHGLVRLDEADGVVFGALDGASPLAMAEARRLARGPVRFKPMDRAAFDRRLSEAYAVDGLDEGELDEGGEDLASLAEGLPQTADLLDTAADDAPVIRLINGLIAQAVTKKASDIHIEPYEKRLSIRLRIDGVLQEILSPPVRLAPLLASRIKVMARLDIAEKRTPQDGRISLALGGKSLDVRVSTLPSRYGERVVLRILDKEEGRFELSELGMSARVLEGYRRALKEPNGVILVTGPTGSGKTTSLYAGLNLLNDQSRNILTVEDPIEYAIDGVGQTQINPKVGMTFAAGLRAILRQDPDVVMVGEIRDVETAQIAVQASLTGHLVLSSVHTNDAVSAVTRLRDMGVEAFLIASTVKAIMAQRLVRALCPACKRPHEASEAEKALLGLKGGEAVTLHAPQGCTACGHKGYEGRLGVYEIVTVDDRIRELIHDDAREAQIAEAAFRNAPTLAQSAFAHVLAGRTSLEEALRVVRVKAEDDGGL